MQSCPNCGGFPTISFDILLECQKRQAGPTVKTDGLTQNSRPPRTLPAFSPRQCCGAQQGEGMGLREPKEGLSLKVPLTEGPALPGCSRSHQSPAGCWGTPRPSTSHAHL